MNKYVNIYVGQDAIFGDLGFLLVKFYAIFFMKFVVTDVYEILLKFLL